MLFKILINIIINCYRRTTITHNWEWCLKLNNWKCCSQLLETRIQTDPILFFILIELLDYLLKKV